MTAMKMVASAWARTTNNLILRDGPGTAHKRLATIQKDVLVQALSDPVGGWVKVKVGGWVSPSYPGKVFSEDHEGSSLQAVRSAVSWERKQFTGYVSTKYLKVIDGPTDG